MTSGTFAAREAIGMLMEKLSPLQLDIEESGTFELVVAEALNNVVEHGYPDPANCGPIKINCTHKSNGLHVHIVDQGLPMPDGKTPLGLAAEVDVDFMDMPEGGFGWFLIKDLAKDVQYERQGDKNCLRLRVAIAMNATAH
ncbi:MAG: ATP-binding protein [Ascidiaceihabitans sp.]|nr:ATP-binding protein [Ascidiaceihabitans sp.]